MDPGQKEIRVTQTGNEKSPIRVVCRFIQIGSSSGEPDLLNDIIGAVLFNGRIEILRSTRLPEQLPEQADACVGDGLGSCNGQIGNLRGEEIMDSQQAHLLLL